MNKIILILGGGTGGLMTGPFPAEKNGQQLPYYCF